MSQRSTKAKAASKAKAKPVYGEFIDKEKARIAVRDHLQKLLAFVDSDDCVLESPGCLGCILRTFEGILLTNKVHLPKRPCDIESYVLPFGQMQLGTHGDWDWQELFKHVNYDESAVNAATNNEHSLENESRKAHARKYKYTIAIFNGLGPVVHYDAQRTQLLRLVEKTHRQQS